MYSNHMKVDILVNESECSSYVTTVFYFISETRSHMLNLEICIDNVNKLAE